MPRNLFNIMRATAILIGFFALFTVFGIHAQTGSISGTIKLPDNNNAVGAEVQLRSTGFSTTTNTNGLFQLAEIPEGTYTLLATLAPYYSLSTQLKVTANTELKLDLTLVNSVQGLEEVIILSGNSAYLTKNPSSSLRIATPLLETAQNIQVVTKAVLDQQQSFDMLESVQRNISGAQRVEHWDNYARINMRGSQLTAFRNGMNVQLSPWSPLTEDMSMVERIEFVKGPAGFMLGNGEPSGFYNVVTKKPTGREKGEVIFSTGSFDLYRFTTDLDGKLSRSGKWLYRINVMGQMKGSHRDFEYTNRYSVAPVIKYLINPNSSFTVEYNEQFVQSSVIGSNYAFSKKGFADLPVNFTTAESNLDPTTMRDRSLLALFEHRINDHWKLTAQAAFLHYKQIGQSIWPWGISLVNDSLMQRGISIWDALGYNRNAQVFVNGNFTTGTLKHTVLAGVDMSHRDYWADWNQGAALGDSTFNIYDPNYGTIAAADIPQWDRTQDIRERGVRYTNGYNSVYAQDEIALFNNRLRVTIAGRYTSVNYNNPYSGNYQRDKITPRAGLSWTFLRNSALYAVYDQAFVANPGRDWQGNDFDPITGTNLEAGVKRDWFNGNWNSSVSVYQTTKNNVLTTDLEHADPVTGQFIYSRQTGQQQVQGVEVDVRGTIFKGLDIVINYAYTDARITKDSDPNVVGRKTAGATDHIQNTWLTYAIPEGKLKGLGCSVGYQFQAGRSSWYVFDQTENGLPDYFRLDAGISYRTKQFSVQLLVNNLLNEYLYSGAPYYGMYYWQTEPGRNVRLTVGYTF